MLTRRNLFNRFLGYLPAGAALLGGATLAVPPSHAATGKGGKEKNKGGKHKGKHGQAFVFSGNDRRLVHDYYFGPSGPPVFLRNPDPLPPGLQKKLIRTGTLPPGWQKRFVPLDPVLVRRLPPIPEYYDRGFIGASLVLVNRNTSVVLDIVSLLD